MIRVLFVLLIAIHAAAQQPRELPEKVRSLKANYEAAVRRVVEPLTRTYQQELEKLKADYTRNGDLAAAIAVETLLKASSQPDGATASGSWKDVPLAQMTADQFKQWLATVVITEATGFRNSYTFDGKMMRSTKPDAPAPRVHENVMIEPGKIFVPFTSTNATIIVDPSLSKAQVTYSTGSKTEATIRPKPEK